MAELSYSNSELVRVGRALAGKILWTPELDTECQRIFAVAHHWRESHVQPMTSLRAGLDGRRRSLGLDGITVSRLKRMRSIRKKLSRTNLRLNQIQDLGGCRSVLTSIDAVNQLCEAFIEKSDHEFLTETNYIDEPKPSGYRCRHLMMRYKGKEAHLHGRKIELQVRTRLQHSWATAVEVVGAFLREDLKASNGNADWLRLFVLMSVEFARAEETTVVAELSNREDCISEIIDLERRLNAVKTLESIRFAFSGTDHIHYPAYTKPKFYLIQFDNEAREVSVVPHFSASSSADAYIIEEVKDQKNNTYRHNTVLVEADQVETVKRAFPNYFGDVQMFTEQLKRLTAGESAVEFTMPPQAIAPREPREAPDMSWFRQHRYRKWE